MVERHWHAYSWTGSGKEIKDVLLRKESPEFRSTPLLPYVMRDSLLKPRSHIRGTFLDAGSAVEWLVAAYKVLPERMYPEQTELTPLTDPDVVAEIISRLEFGLDAQESYWLKGSVRADLRLVGCPSKLDMAIPCPEGR